MVWGIEGLAVGEETTLDERAVTGGFPVAVEEVGSWWCWHC